jgi:hypothetical protein
MLPSLLRVTRSATSEHLLGLLGSSPIPRSVVASRVRLQLRPLPSAGVTRFPQYLWASPPPHTALPDSHELPVDPFAVTAGASRVASGPRCLHAVANTPAGLMKPVRSYCSIGVGLPRPKGGSAPASPVSRPAQRSLALRPACSPSRHCDLFPPKASAASLPLPLLRLLPGGTNQFPGGTSTLCGPAPFHGALSD